MIGVGNHAVNDLPSDDDFTVSHYRELLRLAKTGWDFALYDAIPWGGRFILWRHDLDYSLNRALRLAAIEREEAVRATYFINPHSEFYNLAEPAQFSLIKQILALGHHIGLHFDGAFHDVADEAALDLLVAKEAAYLSELFGVSPVAFSFHNPVASHLNCGADYYGGLLNCYSRRLKSEVVYCSDSNGYWRFRRLHDVLTEATDPCLQVLTHPGWWQERPMSPRQRIFRCAYGRARSTMHRYDQTLAEHGRVNQLGPASYLRILASPLPKAFELCDFLWNEGHVSTLFIELWRLHEAQINRLCKAALRKEWRVPTSEVNAFFGQEGLRVDSFRLFQGLFGETWQALAKPDAGDFPKWVGVRNQLLHGKGTYDRSCLEQGCVFVCDAIRGLSTWGLAQPIAYDGLRHLGSIGLPTVKTADGSLSDRLEEVEGEIPAFPKRRWEEFKASLCNTPPRES